MASKIKQKKFSRTATETNADILERIGGSGGAAYRSSRSKRPNIIKLQKQSTTLKTKAARMLDAKKAKSPKKKNVAGRAGIVAKKAVKVGAAAGLVAVGYGANQWINQKPEKKK
jgi:hypothetical protein